MSDALQCQWFGVIDRRTGERRECRAWAMRQYRYCLHHADEAQTVGYPLGLIVRPTRYDSSQAPDDPA